MPEGHGLYQVVFSGLAPATPDNQKAAYIVKLSAAFHMAADDALHFLQLQNFVLHKHLPQHEAAAFAARFQAMGLDVAAVPMPGSAWPRASRTGYLTEDPVALDSSPSGAPADTVPVSQAPDITICPECQTKNRVKNSADVRCAMCNARIHVLIKS